MNSLDWNLARAFLETAEARSLSAAARRLGLTQPTLSRQVAALEQTLGVLLFERVGKRLALTESGADLLAHVQGMGEAANELMLAAVGRARSVEGCVTLSAGDAFCAYLLPGLLAQIREQAPGIMLRVTCSNAISDLRRREADIAIRHVRPDEPDLIGKLVYQSDSYFYASRQWVERNGVPGTPQDVPAGDLIYYAEPDHFAEHLSRLGFPITAQEFRLGSDNWVVIWEMIKSGLGIGVMAAIVAARTPGVVRVLPDLTSVPVPVWLVAHRELRTSRRIRIVFDLLAQEIARSAPHDERIGEFAGG